jgi:hypothetical protein
VMARLVLWSVVVVASASVAQEPKLEGEAVGSSAQNFALEFRLGAYQPLVKNEAALGNKNPYETTFGTGPMLLGELEFNYQFFRQFGSIAAGFSAGYAEKYGKAVGDNGQATTETTALQVVPMRALLIYRFDVLAKRFRVPLVPYAKVGLAATYWWSTKGGVLENFDDVEARGVKWGFAGQFGLMLQLDFLDQRLAHDFDVDVGVNHSYLFGEWNIQEINNFGRGGLDLSSRHWMFGLAFEL